MTDWKKYVEEAPSKYGQVGEALVEFWKYAEETNAPAPTKFSFQDEGEKHFDITWVNEHKGRTVSAQIYEEHWNWSSTSPYGVGGFQSKANKRSHHNKVGDGGLDGFVLKSEISSLGWR